MSMISFEPESGSIVCLLSNSCTHERTVEFVNSLDAGIGSLIEVANIYKQQTSVRVEIFQY
jgi:hypothetical protein